MWFNSIQQRKTLRGLDMPRILLKERVPSKRGQTAGDKPEEGEDDVKSSCPLCPGRHTCYNGRENRNNIQNFDLTFHQLNFSDFRRN
ncbi:hypothetical protein H5410_018910 [Solanum commersonii]|uniref:Uncharacterized protein n=1 Tax=Solanum commersonii TaxID=4109 RepID=A0A9J6A394_SOLCO|nr:hypothetical protein H5410_018910 [Solanum commersonii]